MNSSDNGERLSSDRARKSRLVNRGLAASSFFFFFFFEEDGRDRNAPRLPCAPRFRRNERDRRFIELD